VYKIPVAEFTYWSHAYLAVAEPSGESNQLCGVLASQEVEFTISNLDVIGLNLNGAIIINIMK
jgi:hypothetical protein